MGDVGMSSKTHLVRMFGFLSLYVLASACSSAGEWEMSNIKNATRRNLQSPLSSAVKDKNLNNTNSGSSTNGNASSSNAEESGKDLENIVVQDEDGNSLRFTSKSDCSTEDDTCVRILTVIFDD